MSKHAAAIIELDQSQKFIEESRRREEIANLRDIHQELLKELNSFEDAQRQLFDLHKQETEIAIDESKVQSLRALSRVMEAAMVRTSASATKLVLKPLSSHRAFIDGNLIESEAVISIHRQTTIKLDGWGEMGITPGGDETDEYARQAEMSRSEFELALAETGVADLNEAEELLQGLKTIKALAEAL